MSKFAALVIPVVSLIFPLAACVDAREASMVVYEDSTVFLQCQNAAIDQREKPSDAMDYLWVTPSGNMLRVHNQTDSIPTKHSLLEKGFILQIQDLHEEDLGLYICLVFSNRTSNNCSSNDIGGELVEVVKRTLVGHGWTREVIEDYSVRIEYGCLAGFVVLVVMAMACYNYNQHQDRHDVSRETGIKSPTNFSSKGQELPSILITQHDKKVQQHQNQGFQKDENENDDGMAEVPL